MVLKPRERIARARPKGVLAGFVCRLENRFGFQVV